MKSKTLARIAKRKKDLKILKRAYAHIDGRIREVENELDFLEELRKAVCDD